MRRGVFILSVGAVLGAFVCCGGPVLADKLRDGALTGISTGMPDEAFARLYPKKRARTYRQEGDRAWLTFGVPQEGVPRDLITFHLVDGQLKDWQWNDRDEVVREYLGEFCSQGIIHGMPVIYAALQDVITRLSGEDFLKVTDRRRPVLFTEYYAEGTARFANTSEIIAGEDDALAAEQGLTLIKLSSALNEPSAPDAVKGVVAHELAHRVLDHARKGHVSCASEREANALIRRWGFEAEFAAAKKAFGSRPGEPASCQE